MYFVGIWTIAFFSVCSFTRFSSHAVGMHVKAYACSVFPIPFHIDTKKNPDWREHSYFCYYSVRHVALARSYAYENVWQYLYFSLVIDTCSRKNGISWLNYVNNRTWTVLRYACYRYLPVSYEICCFDFLRKIAHAKYIAIPAQHRTTDTKNGFFFTWKKNMFCIKYIIKIKWHSSKRIRIGISSKKKCFNGFSMVIFFYSFVPKCEIRRKFVTQVCNNKPNNYL